MTDVYNARFLFSGVGFLKVTVQAESLTFFEYFVVVVVVCYRLSRFPIIDATG